MLREPLAALNPAHLESLLGQEVVITLGDASTRQGTMFNVDPVNLSVALRKPRPPLLVGHDNSAIHNTTSHNDQSFCVIPGDTVKAVEVVGGGARALEALGLTKASSMPRVSHDGAGVSSALSNPFSQSPLGSPFNKRSPVLKSGGYWRKDESLSSSMHTPRSPLARAGSNDSDKDSDLDATSFDANTFPVFLRERFARVRELLESARIPVYVERGYESSHDVLIAMGCVRVTAPYGVQNCECGNLAVLERVREIVGDAK